MLHDDVLQSMPDRRKCPGPAADQGVTCGSASPQLTGYRMDQAFFSSLAERLPALDPGLATDEAARRYAGYYGIDFRDRAQQHLGRIDVDGFSVATQIWKPPVARGTLLILHGYYDHMGLYRHLIQWALEQHYAVLAFDLPGHGLSSGEVSTSLPPGHRPREQSGVRRRCPFRRASHLLWYLRARLLFPIRRILLLPMQVLL